MNELISLNNTLNAMVTNYTTDRVVQEFTQFAKLERVSGVAKIKLILTAKEVMTKEDFAIFKNDFELDAPFISKCKKAETPLRMIELCDSLNVEDFSTTQLIEMSAIKDDKLASYLLDGTITAFTTCAEIRQLAKVLDDVITDEEYGEDVETIESPSNTPIEVATGLGVVSIKITDIKKMLECTNIVDIKKMLGAYVNDVDFSKIN